MKSKILQNKGFTGIELTVALLILMIFISVITVTFTNIYLSFTDNKRNSEATAYATKIIEMVEKMYYAEVTNENLAQKVLEMNIPKGYDIGIQVDSYKKGEANASDLVKNVVITVKYQVGKQEKNVRFETVKSKEILITPNKPVLQSGMIPIKFIVTDRNTNAGYWQIAAENDPTWYSYENKRWANAAIENQVTVEGGTIVTEQNKNTLIGKKVEKIQTAYVWIPRYAYKDKDATFIYSTGNNFVDSSGNLQDISTKDGYQINTVFQDKKGFWALKYNTSTLAENALKDTANSQINAVKILTETQYGDIANLVI